MLYQDSQKKWFMFNILQMLGKPYIWGGDNPIGFDCSGMVVDGLRSVGYIKPSQDYTADDMWRIFKERRFSGEPKESDLIFWLRENGMAYHVAVALDEHFCLTADKGGSHIRTMDDAIKHDAFIKIRPINHRSTEPKLVRLF